MPSRRVRCVGSMPHSWRGRAYIVQKKRVTGIRDLNRDCTCACSLLPGSPCTCCPLPAQLMQDSLTRSAFPNHSFSARNLKSTLQGGQARPSLLLYYSSV